MRWEDYRGTARQFKKKAQAGGDMSKEKNRIKRKRALKKEPVPGKNQNSDKPSIERKKGKETEEKKEVVMTPMESLEEALLEADEEDQIIFGEMLSSSKGVEQFIKLVFGSCPKCGSWNIKHNDSETEPDNTKMVCLDCGTLYCLYCFEPGEGLCLHFIVCGNCEDRLTDEETGFCEIFTFECPTILRWKMKQGLVKNT